MIPGFARFCTSGFWLMLMTALLFGLVDVIIKLLSSSCTPMQIGFVRFLLGGAILLPVLVSKRIPLQGNRTGILVLRGLFGTVSFFCMLESIARIPLANVIVLFYTYPLFVVLFSFFLFRIRITRGEVALIATGLWGIYLLIDPDFRALDPGYLFALLASGLAGIAIVLTHKARQTNDPFIIYFYFCLVGLLFCLPFFVRAPGPHSLPQWLLLVLASLLLLAAQVLMNQGFKYCRASEGALIMMSETVFAGIAGVLFFHDPVTVRLLAGALLILGSGVGLNLLDRRSRALAVSE